MARKTRKINIGIDTSAACAAPRVALKKIEAMMAEQIREETGASVEITNRGVNQWTASGAWDAVDIAMAWMVGTGTTTENGRVYDEELCESFAYFTTNARPTHDPRGTPGIGGKD
jgi:hypothetical protein